jgi:hypothetical protein
MDVEFPKTSVLAFDPISEGINQHFIHISFICHPKYPLNPMKG